MVKWILVAVAALTLTVGCMKSPMDTGDHAPQQVEVLDPEGNLTVMGAQQYEMQLQAQIVSECRQFELTQLQLSWAGISELQGTEKLVAIVSNQWKEAMIAMEGQSTCEPGTNAYDAYIAYAEAQGKIWEVVVGETGKTFRFGVGSLVAGNIAEKLIGGIGDKVSGDKLTAGHNATKTQDQAESSVSSSENFEANESHNTSSQVGTSDSTIDHPTATSGNGTGGGIGPDGEVVPEELTEEWCNSQGLTLRDSTGECITYEYKSNIENSRLVAGEGEEEEEVVE